MSDCTLASAFSILSLPCSERVIACISCFSSVTCWSFESLIWSVSDAIRSNVERRPSLLLSSLLSLSDWFVVVLDSSLLFSFLLDGDACWSLCSESLLLESDLKSCWILSNLSITDSSESSVVALRVLAFVSCTLLFESSFSSVVESLGLEALFSPCWRLSTFLAIESKSDSILSKSLVISSLSFSDVSSSSVFDDVALESVDFKWLFLSFASFIIRSILDWLSTLSKRSSKLLISASESSFKSLISSLACWILSAMELLLEVFSTFDDVLSESAKASFVKP